MIATTRISVNVEEEVKLGAQRVLSEIGMDLTTAIDSFLRTIVREERIPYELRTERAYREQVAHGEYIRAELEKAKLKANDPNTKWVSQDEMLALLAKQRDNRSRV